MGALKPAHGGDLRNLYLGAEEAAETKARSTDLKSWDLTPRQMCDIELILNGDILNFLQVDYRGHYLTVITEPICMDILQRIVSGHPVFFKALRDFADRQPRGLQQAQRGFQPHLAHQRRKRRVAFGLAQAAAQRRRAHAEAPRLALSRGSDRRLAQNQMPSSRAFRYWRMDRSGGRTNSLRLFAHRSVRAVGRSAGSERAKAPGRRPGCAAFVDAVRTGAGTARRRRERPREGRPFHARMSRIRSALRRPPPGP